MKIHLNISFSEYIKENLKNNLNENFWNWFGNSVMIDNNEPIIVYHSSNNNFDKFDRKRIHYVGCNGDGFYFTKDENYSKTYGDNIGSYYVRICKPLKPDTKILTKKDYIKLLDYIWNDEEYKDGLYNYGYFNDYTKFRNELVNNLITKTDYVSLFDLVHTSTGSLKYLFDALKENGSEYFDGVISDGFGELVVFEPNHIKSIENDGTWDINDDNIFS